MHWVVWTALAFALVVIVLAAFFELTPGSALLVTICLALGMLGLIVVVVRPEPQLNATLLWYLLSVAAIGAIGYGVMRSRSGKRNNE